MARKCYTNNFKVMLKSTPRRPVHNIENVIGGDEVDLDSRLNDEVRVEPIESTIKYQFDSEHKYTHVGQAFVNDTEAQQIL